MRRKSKVENRKIDYDQILEDLGFDPKEFEIIKSPQASKLCLFILSRPRGDGEKVID